MKDYEWGKEHPSKLAVTRLLAFTDGVVAIDLTLLILPALEIEMGEGQDVWATLGGEWETLLSFLLSFVMTLAFWRRHHRIFNGLVSFTPELLAMNGAWLLGITFLQVPSQFLGHNGPEGGVLALYVGTLAFLSWVNVLVTFYLGAHKGTLLAGSAVISASKFYIVVIGAVWLTITAAAAQFDVQAGLLMLGLSVLVTLAEEREALKK